MHTWSVERTAKECAHDPENKSSKYSHEAALLGIGREIAGQHVKKEVELLPWGGDRTIFKFDLDDRLYYAEQRIKYLERENNALRDWRKRTQSEGQG